MVPFYNMYGSQVGHEGTYNNVMVSVGWKSPLLITSTFLISLQYLLQNVSSAVV